MNAPVPAVDRTAVAGGGGINGHIWSNFLITITSNLPNTPANRILCVNGGTAALQQMLTVPTLWTWLHVQNGNGAFFRAFQPGEQQLVKWVRARTAFEFNGPRNPTPHVHVYMEICHTTNIQLNYGHLRTAIRAGLAGFTPAQRAGVNIDIRFVNPANPLDKNWTLHYLLKQGVPAAPPADQDPNFSVGFVDAMQNPPPIAEVPIPPDIEHSAHGQGIPVANVYPRPVLGQGADQATDAGDDAIAIFAVDHFN